MDRDDLAELFAAFGAVEVRRMFSGFGLYADGVCFSLFLRGELYLKADETTAPRFVGEGVTPFSYTQTRSGEVITVNSFWRLPARLYDDPDELADWARQALTVAQRLKATKAVSKRSASRPQAARVTPKKSKSKAKARRTRL